MTSDAVNPAPTAVILASGLNGLGAIRSLHRARVRTLAVVTERDDPSRLSRLPNKTILMDGDSNGFADRLLGCLGAVEAGRPVVIPTSDRFVSLMSQHSAALSERVAFCIPSEELTATLVDKHRETELIERLGIPMPRTVRDLPASASELTRLLRLPIIVKPRSFSEVAVLGSKNTVLLRAGDVDAFYARFGGGLSAFVAQEVIPGGDDRLWVCNCTSGPQHELVRAFTFQRLGLYPPHYGVTTYAISEVNVPILDAAERLVRGLGYIGPAMIEFKFDDRDGEYKYIEMNPRLGLCNYFDTMCGVNNVLCTYLIAAGHKVERQSSPQREGVVYLRLMEDLSARRLDGQPFSETLRLYMKRLHLPHVGGRFAWSDPWPAISLTTRDAARALGATLRRTSAAGRPERDSPSATEEGEKSRAGH